MLVSSLLGNEHEVVSGIAPRIITVYGPALAALVVTVFSQGSKEVKSLLEKLTPRSKHFGWIVSIPILFTTITFASFRIGGTTTEQLMEFLKSRWDLLVFQFIGQLLIIGIGEELGWRGWLLPKLTQRLSLGSSFLLVTIIWGAWHLPLFFNPIRLVVAWSMVLVSMSVIMTWIWYKVQGNVFVLVVTHASINAPEIFLENRLTKTTNGHLHILWGWEAMGYMYLSMAVILAISSYRLWTRKLVTQSLATVYERSR
jgi:membrane protease YdiL (CAAX protease family)